MQVAAACFSVLESCQPDALWTPPLGVLFVRMLVAPWTKETQFAYADDAARPSHHKSIARIHNWCGEPDFGGWTSGDKGDISHSAAGAAIVRRIVYREDIEALVRLWRHRCTVEEWARNVVQYEPKLCTESKAMVAEVCAEQGKVPT